MTHKDMHKRPYSMGMVKQELQHLVTQHIPSKKRIFSRRTLFRGLAGLAGLAAVSSWLTWQVELQTQPMKPHPTYSPKLGGTISTYDTQSGVLGVAWSPNGTRLVMGDWRGQVQAWDASTGQHVLNFHAPGLGRQK